jgi:hypothetical protein
MNSGNDLLGTPIEINGGSLPAFQYLPATFKTHGPGSSVDYPGFQQYVLTTDPVGTYGITVTFTGAVLS